jgi:hypothetical protein
MGFLLAGRLNIGAFGGASCLACTRSASVISSASAINSDLKIADALGIGSIVFHHLPYQIMLQRYLGLSPS